MDWYDGPVFSGSFILLFLAGYFLLILTSPAATAMRYAVAALWRHAGLVWLLIAFAFTTTLASIGVQLWLMAPSTTTITPDFLQELLAWNFSPAPLSQALQNSWQPALQNSLGLFHCAITTFPLAIPAALLFLLNPNGLFKTLVTHLWRRDHIASLPSILFLLLAAVAECTKPIALWPGLLPETPAFLVAREIWLWLAFAFEYALGVFIQVALALRVFEWLRGMHFEEDRLRDTVMRRFVIVWHWLWIVFLVSSLLFYFPPILALATGEPLTTQSTLIYDLAFALFLLPFAPMQALLIFHNFRMRKAFSGNFRFLRQHAATIFWILLLALLHWLLLETFLSWLANSLGGQTLWALLVRLLGSIPVAILTAWLFATWISLFKQVESGHEKEPDWLHP